MTQLSEPDTALDDRFDVRLARGAGDLLRAFNEIGLLSAADVHVAGRLCAFAGERDETVALAAAFAVRGPRLGHVLTDLATIRETATVDSDEPIDLSALPWPAPGRLARRRRRQPARGGRRGRARRASAPPRRNLPLPRPLLARGGARRR